MEVTIKEIELNNFKGIQHYNLKVEGRSLLITGQNKTGKTTLADAYSWVLTGKDSLGRSDFDIKTLDSNNDPVSGLDHSVRIVLTKKDGDVQQDFQLERIYKEKWTKRRGEAQKRLTGHKTEYYIDNVPKTMTEYEKFISDLIDIDSLLLLSNVSYFPSLPWQKRRQLIMRLVGDVSFEDIINSDSELKRLPEILGDRTIQEHIKIITSRQKKINERLKEIPARIDEQSRTASLDEARNAEAIRKSIKSLEKKKKAIESSQTEGSRIQRIKDTRARIKYEQDLANYTRREEKGRIQVEINLRADRINQLSSKLNIARNNLDRDKTKAVALKADIERLKSKYEELSAAKPEVSNKCPTCGQDIPQAEVEEAIRKLNQSRAKELAEIDEKGRTYSKELRQIEPEIEKHKTEIAGIEEKISGIKDEINDLKAKIETAGSEKNEHDTEVSNLQAILEELEAQNQHGIVQADTSEIEAKIEAERTALAGLEAARKAMARIEELKDEQKALSDEFEKNEKERSLIERYIVKEVELIEDNINSLFRITKFKMFDVQINGGINPVCDILQDGVSYYKGLNGGSRVNVGLDIINTFSRILGKKVPVWVDNAESVTEIFTPETQTIFLYAKNDVKKLTVVEI